MICQVLMTLVMPCWCLILGAKLLLSQWQTAAVSFGALCRISCCPCATHVCCHHAQVVKARGESMAAASAQGKPHGMLSVIGLSDADLETICAEARAKLGGDSVCKVANYLFPQVSKIDLSHCTMPLHTADPGSQAITKFTA